jgi:hypothetical protein
MKKLSDLSIADLKALYDYFLFEQSKNRRNYSRQILRVENEIDSRIMEIEDFKDI